MLSAALRPPRPDTIPPDSLRRVEELRVTVTRSSARLRELPAAVSVVSAEELGAGERGLSLAEGLRGVPGVFVQNRRNVSLGDRLTIRGTGARAQFGVRGVQVVADGVPLTMPDGQATLTNLDLTSAGRIEVVRGPASALYGNGAGGVLRVRTRDFAPQSLRAETELLGGAHGFLQSRVSASGRLGGAAGSAGYRLSAVRMEREGFREHSGAEVYRGNLVMGGRPSEATELRGVLNVYHTPFAENPSSVDRETARTDPRATRPLVREQGLGEEATQGQAGLTLRHRLSAGTGLEATLWGVERSVWNPIPFRIIDVSRRAAGLRSEVNGRLGRRGASLRWTAGLDAGHQRDDREELENLGVDDGGAGASEARAREGELLLDQAERVTSLAPFLRLEIAPARRWRITLGGRYDATRFAVDDRFLADGDDSGSRLLDRFSPSAGVTYLASGSLGLFASYASAFETPTASELSNRPSGGGGFDPELGPSVQRGFEVGARGALGGERASWELVLYRTEVDDALVPFEGATGEVFFRNAGEVERDGLELSVDASVLSRLDARLSYTLQDHRFERFVVEGDDVSGNREPGVPPHRVHAGLVARGPLGLRGEVDLGWVDAMPVDDANRAENPSYTVVDLRLSRWGVGTVRPVLGVDNLFDERYNGSVVPNAFGGRYFEPSPGRTFYGGIRLEGGL